ncbi:hypothetical protein L6164_022694 [Bauhinia variegata]|nr:hypothetical protein L6164_022694 [Bauhinia variegata]
MSTVVSMLEGKTPVQAPISKHNDMSYDPSFKAFETISLDSQTVPSSAYSQENQKQRIKSMDAQWVDSSTSLPSANDHYSSPSRLLQDSGVL